VPVDGQRVVPAGQVQHRQAVHRVGLLEMAAADQRAARAGERPADVGVVGQCIEVDQRLCLCRREVVVRDLTDMVDAAHDHRLDQVRQRDRVAVAAGVGTGGAGAFVQLQVSHQAGLGAGQRRRHAGQNVVIAARDVPDAHLVQAADQVGQCAGALDIGTQPDRVGIAAGRILAQAGEVGELHAVDQDAQGACAGPAVHHRGNMVPLAEPDHAGGGLRALPGAIRGG